MRLFVFLSIFIPLLLLYSCSSDVSGAKCETDEQCPSGQYCGEDKVCHKGTKPIKDVGLDAGRDAGKDASTDAGKDAITDKGFDDIYEDTEDTYMDIEDAGNEDTLPDAEFTDVEEDAITDITTDISQDISIIVKQNSIYDMSAGKINAGDYKIKTVTGTNASPIINVDGLKVYKNKNHSK